MCMTFSSVENWNWIIYNYELQIKIDGKEPELWLNGLVIFGLISSFGLKKWSHWRNSICDDRYIQLEVRIKANKTPTMIKPSGCCVGRSIGSLFWICTLLPESTEIFFNFSRISFRAFHLYLPQIFLLLFSFFSPVMNSKGYVLVLGPAFLTFVYSACFPVGNSCIELHVR